MKRLFDIVVAGIILAVTSPLILAAALVTRLVSPGPAFYRAQRVGRGGTDFSMYKIRSMHVVQTHDAVITAPGDSRVFPFGRLMRATKIDELPQFWNVLRGDMSIVGPRPEDPKIVREHYSDWMMKTLDVRPGVTSPGAVFGYLEGDAYLDGADDVEQAYVDKLLPAKMNVEIDYLARASLLGDTGVIFKTARAIIVRGLSK